MNLNNLLKETKQLKNEEIKLYIKELIKEHKLDDFNP